MLAYAAAVGDPASGQPLGIRLGGATQTENEDLRVFVPEPRTDIGLVAALPIAFIDLGRA